MKDPRALSKTVLEDIVRQIQYRMYKTDDGDWDRDQEVNGGDLVELCCELLEEHDLVPEDWNSIVQRACKDFGDDRLQYDPLGHKLILILENPHMELVLPVSELQFLYGTVDEEEEKAGSISYRYTVEGHPLVGCPNCSAWLTLNRSVQLTTNVNGVVRDHETRLDTAGHLVDVEDTVANGYHVGTRCGACGALLDACDEVVETRTDGNG